jgi:hypothetical protein
VQVERQAQQLAASILEAFREAEQQLHSQPALRVLCGLAVAQIAVSFSLNLALHDACCDCQK